MRRESGEDPSTARPDSDQRCLCLFHSHDYFSIYLKKKTTIRFGHVHQKKSLFTRVCCSKAALVHTVNVDRSELEIHIDQHSLSLYGKEQLGHSAKYLFFVFAVESLYI